MNPFDVIMVMVAVLQMISTALIGWVIISMYGLNREVGELLANIKNIINQSEKKSEELNRRFDDKQNKDQ